MSVQVNPVITCRFGVFLSSCLYSRPKLVGSDHRSSVDVRTSSSLSPGTIDGGRCPRPEVSKTARPQASQSHARWKYGSSCSYETGQEASAMKGLWSKSTSSKGTHLPPQITEVPPTWRRVVRDIGE